MSSDFKGCLCGQKNSISQCQRNLGTFLSVANSCLFFLKGLGFPPAQIANVKISGGMGKELQQ